LELIIHKINTIRELRKIPKKFGTEIDIRAWGSNLILNHEPYYNGEKLEDYLDAYNHGTLILNIKETGIEKDVLDLVKKRSKINQYFLLDVETPYLFDALKSNEKNIAIRFSEIESIETVKYYIGKVNWVWIDTIEFLPLNIDNIEIINKFKKCLVCPSRWNQKHKIKTYFNILKKLNINIDSVMTSFDNISNYSEYMILNDNN